MGGINSQLVSFEVIFQVQLVWYMGACTVRDAQKVTEWLCKGTLFAAPANECPLIRILGQVSSDCGCVKVLCGLDRQYNSFQTLTLARSSLIVLMAPCSKCAAFNCVNRLHVGATGRESLIHCNRNLCKSGGGVYKNPFNRLPSTK